MARVSRVFAGEYTGFKKGEAKRVNNRRKVICLFFFISFAPAKAHLPGSLPRLGPCNSHDLQLSGSIDNNNNSIEREETVSREWKENNR